MALSLVKAPAKPVHGAANFDRSFSSFAANVVSTAHLAFDELECRGPTGRSAQGAGNACSFVRNGSGASPPQARSATRRTLEGRASSAQGSITGLNWLRCGSKLEVVDHIPARANTQEKNAEQ